AAEDLGPRRKSGVIDVAIEGLVHAEHELGHPARPYASSSAAATRAPRCSRTRALDVTLRGVLLASLATEGSSPRSRAEYRHAQSSRGMLLHLARWLRRRAPAD